MRGLGVWATVVFALCLYSAPPAAQEPDSKSKEEAETQARERINNLQAPLYSAFTERYILDELKQLRSDMAAQRHELMQQILDREHRSVDRGVEYATNAVTYFFYLIAAATSILVIVGWTSLREIKERVHALADEEISKLVQESEERLHAIEEQLNQKTQHIEENRDEIALTQEVQSLWLRAAQDANPHNKIAIYDQILKLRNNDCEALTYKADAALELHEPQWAINLCDQALRIDPENSQAFYQLACAHTVMGHFKEAVHYLKEALDRSEHYREELYNEPLMEPLHSYEPFQELLQELLPANETKNN